MTPDVQYAGCCGPVHLYSPGSPPPPPLACSPSYVLQSNLQKLSLVELQVLKLYFAQPEFAVVQFAKVSVATAELAKARLAHAKRPLQQFVLKLNRCVESC